MTMAWTGEEIGALAAGWFEHGGARCPRCADEGRELTYVPIHGATRHGVRPPKLEKRVWLPATVERIK